jgi:dynein heavy chain
VPVVTEGRPEEWLNRVEEAMFATTKKHLYKVLEESKGEAGHKWLSTVIWHVPWRRAATMCS